MLRACVLLLFVLTLTFPTIAQDDRDPEAALLTYGEAVAGTLDNREPRVTYHFDGLRGEAVTIRLNVTTGNLDPVLLLLDPADNTLMLRDDSGGESGVLTGQLRLPANGRYTLTIGRFGGRVGSTSGRYELRLDRSGASSESGSALRYGDMVVNRITSDFPEVYFTFRAQRGDIITLTMRRGSGNLDPYLRVVNAARQIVAENDDYPGSNDARISDLVIEEDGQYLIIASRYGFSSGTSTGSFFLSLERSDKSGEGGSSQVAIRLLPGQAREGEITSERPLVYYYFEARRDDVITLRMSRLSGTLDAFLELTNAGLQPLISNDDIEDGINRDALISQFRIPADGLYYVLATRFEREAGSTIGRYRLELTSRGNLFDGIAGAVRMNYGTTATGVLNDETPELLFAFYGAQGDVITASVNRSNGDLEPAVTLLDQNQNVLTTGENEETISQIESYTLPRAGVYYLRASRAGGSGGFIVVLAQRFE